MSGIVLSASVRQNLLSLQSTADLLSTTQNRLATGKKVNSALDNPTNFFTAAGLDSRAGDINNLLDGIGNGVQVLQAANTGHHLLAEAGRYRESIANQALQIPVGLQIASRRSRRRSIPVRSPEPAGHIHEDDNTYVGTVANNKNRCHHRRHAAVGCCRDRFRSPPASQRTIPSPSMVRA